MKKNITKSFTLFVLMVVTISSSAQNQINVVTSAVPFLRISPDARSAGMGELSIATIGDANSSFANNGRTPFNVDKAGFSVNYTPWLRDLGVNDVFLASLSGYYKIDEDEQQAVSASLKYFSLGSIQFTDALGNELSTYRPKEFAFDIGYSRKLSDKNGLGIALRYINSSLARGDYNGQSYKPGSSVAADIHYYHHGLKENGEGLNYGATLSNLGTKIAYSTDASQKDFIPANLGLGVAYTKVFDEMSKVTFGLDLNKLLVPTTGTSEAELAAYHNMGVVSSWFKSFGEGGGLGEEFKEINFSLGAEYWYNNQFAFRAGYFYENPEKGNRKYITVGAGLKYNMFGLNFSYVFPSGNGITRIPLSNTWRFGLNFKFDEMN